MNETRGSEASDRARSAGERVEELEDRLRRLRSGERVTEDDVLHAEQAAARGGERSAEAHRKAYLAYRRAAETHEATARALDAGGHHDQADEHRRRAAADFASAEDQARLAQAEGTRDDAVGQ